MWFALAVGEPSLGRFTGGGFDFTSPWVAAGLLLLLKILGFRMRWAVVILAVLAAPLIVALSERISFPLAAAFVLTGAAAVAAASRRSPGRRTSS